MKSARIGLAAICVAMAGVAGCESPAYVSASPPATSSARPSQGAKSSSPASGSKTSGSKTSGSNASGSKFYLGVYEKTDPGTYRPVAKFAKAIGRKPRIVLYFSGWGEAFQTTFAQQVYAHGGMPLVQMNPSHISLTAIAAGKYDSYLISFADQVRAFGHPVVIGFAHEMNGWWYSWGWTHASPASWIAAWRHVVTVFRQQGASNVKWLWTINRGVGGKYAPPRVYWPGKAYVNWVGIDGYYFKRKQDFAKNFAPTVLAVRKFTADPIILGETAIGQVAGQAREIPDLFAGMRKYHLQGFVWYDVAQHGGVYHQDWRLEGHAAAIAALRQGLRSEK